MTLTEIKKDVDTPSFLMLLMIISNYVFNELLLSKPCNYVNDVIKYDSVVFKNETWYHVYSSLTFTVYYVIIILLINWNVWRTFPESLGVPNLEITFVWSSLIVMVLSVRLVKELVRIDSDSRECTFCSGSAYNIVLKLRKDEEIRFGWVWGNQHLKTTGNKSSFYWANVFYWVLYSIKIY